MEQIGLPGFDPQRIQDKILEQKLKNVEKASLEKGSDDQMRQVSRDMEAIFLRILLDSMQKTVPENSLFGQSSGMDTWKEMFNEKLADHISRYSSIGLSDMIYKQLSRDGLVDAPSAGAGKKDSTVPAAETVPSAPAAQSAEPAAGSDSSVGADRLSSLRSLIQDTASRNGLDPSLISAVIMQESGGDPRAVSPAGARGLMQLMPTTADSLGVTNPFDPSQNVEAGASYLRQMLERFGGDEKLALAAYNAGPGTVERYGGVPPYRETRNYVDRVLEMKKLFTEFSGI